LFHILPIIINNSFVAPHNNSNLVEKFLKMNVFLLFCFFVVCFGEAWKPISTGLGGNAYYTSPLLCDGAKTAAWSRKSIASGQVEKVCFYGWET
jgi:hypothetical protein